MQRKVRSFMSKLTSQKKRNLYHINIYLYIEHIIIFVFTKAPLFSVTLTVTYRFFSSLFTTLIAQCLFLNYVRSKVSANRIDVKSNFNSYKV